MLSGSFASHKYQYASDGDKTIFKGGHSQYCQLSFVFQRQHCQEPPVPGRTTGVALKKDGKDIQSCTHQHCPMKNTAFLPNFHLLRKITIKPTVHTATKHYFRCSPWLYAPLRLMFSGISLHGYIVFHWLFSILHANRSKLTALAYWIIWYTTSHRTCLEIAHVEFAQHK